MINKELWRRMQRYFASEQCKDHMHKLALYSLAAGIGYQLLFFGQAPKSKNREGDDDSYT